MSVKDPREWATYTLSILLDSRGRECKTPVVFSNVLLASGTSHEMPTMTAHNNNVFLQLFHPHIVVVNTGILITGFEQFYSRGELGHRAQKWYLRPEYVVCKP